MTVTVPPTAHAEIYIPAASMSSVRLPLRVGAACRDDGFAVVEVGAGRWEFGAEHQVQSTER